MTKKSFLKIYVVLSALVLSAGCSIQGEVKDLTVRTRTPVLVNTRGLSSGSRQVEVNKDHYVSASLGSYHAETEQKVLGYSVYSSVQGGINGESWLEKEE